MSMRTMPCLALLLGACAPANDASDTHLADAKQADGAIDGCQVYDGPKHTVGQAVAPMGDWSDPEKTDNGYWDQNYVAACYLVSLVNGNIDAGGDDSEGQLMDEVIDAVNDQGIATEDLYDGANAEERSAIRNAKQTAMGNQGLDVTFQTKTIRWPTDVVDVIDDIAETLQDGGAVTVWAIDYDRKKAHQMQVTNAWKNGGSTQLWIRDPNSPDEIDIVTIGGNNKVATNITGNFFMQPGVDIYQFTLEKRD